MRVLSTPILLPDPSEIFRPDLVEKESNWEFRNFSSESEDPWMNMVNKTYKEMHTHQTVDFVREKINHWSKFDKFKCGMLDALEMLNNFVDESDVDISIPNSIHGYQTAERIRKCHPDKDWLHLVGLIHDVGKVMAMYGEPQWCVVGDTFPVGCAVAPSVVLAETTFKDNKDLKNPRYNTLYGMYAPNCGLDNVMMSWGHDEYMYRVLKNHKCTLPEPAFDIIRYHSFYPWHTGGDYQHLCNDKDKEMMSWIQLFNKFDLYTKKEAVPDVEELKPYYQGLIDKYCPGEISF